MIVFYTITVKLVDIFVTAIFGTQIIAFGQIYLLFLEIFSTIELTNREPNSIIGERMVKSFLRRKS